MRGYITDPDANIDIWYEASTTLANDDINIKEGVDRIEVLEAEVNGKKFDLTTQDGLKKYQQEAVSEITYDDIVELIEKEYSIIVGDGFLMD